MSADSSQYIRALNQLSKAKNDPQIQSGWKEIGLSLGHRYDPPNPGGWPFKKRQIVLLLFRNLFETSQIMMTKRAR